MVLFACWRPNYSISEPLDVNTPAVIFGFSSQHLDLALRGSHRFVIVQVNLNLEVNSLTNGIHLALLLEHDDCV